MFERVGDGPEITVVNGTQLLDGEVEFDAPILEVPFA
jgi:hypothetical protein